MQGATREQCFRRTVMVLALVAGMFGFATSPTSAAVPFAFDSTLRVIRDTPTTVFLTGNVDDADKDPLTFAVVSAPTHGTLGNCTTGACQYTPVPGYAGTDQFTWRANDGTANSNLGTVSITVTADPNGPAITNPGPLTRIQISPTLNCAVDHAGDTFGAFYADIACGTAAVVDDVLYMPATLPGAEAAAPFTPVSQSAVSGAGTVANPYTLSTTVSLGATGVQLVQTDTYVVGQETYRTDIQVRNSASARTIRLYRAGDCQLGEVTDFAHPEVAYGTGAVVPAGSVACTKGPRALQFLPLSAGSHYYEARYDQVWDRISAKAAFPDTCLCAETIDNGAGLQWDVVLAASASATRSSVLTSSPTGAVPLLVDSSASPSAVDAGDPVTYTVTVTNPGAVPATLNDIADSLPPGFVVQQGTTSGVTSADPIVSAGVLHWPVSSIVPAGGAVSLSFEATAPNASGAFTNNATATATYRYVVASGPSATVSVTAPNAAPNAVGDLLATTPNTPAGKAVLANDTDADGDTLTITAKTDGQHGTVTCTATMCTYTPAAGYVGEDSFSYTVSDGHGGSAVGTVSVTVAAINHAPNAVNDSSTTSLNTAVNTLVLANDTDPDQDQLAVIAKANGAHGTVTCTATSCTYTPAAGFAGTDAYSYTISDGRGLTDTAIVTVTVTSFNLGVVIQPLSVSTTVGALSGYRIAVFNLGPTAAPASTLRSTFPAGFQLRDVSAPGCVTLAGKGCALGPIAPSGSVQILVRGAFTRHGALDGAASVTAFGDADQGNNSAVTLTTVSGLDCTRVGTFGNDRLGGSSGRDVLCGLAGNDTLSPLLGNDVVYGNEGTDTVVYSAVARAVRVNLGGRIATGQGTDALSSIENATGSRKADVLIGDALANLLTGLAGNDTLKGLGGRDRLVGGAGLDKLFGGSGNDALVGGAGKDNCTQRSTDRAGRPC